MCYLLLRIFIISQHNLNFSNMIICLFLFLCVTYLPPQCVHNVDISDDEQEDDDEEGHIPSGIIDNGNI